MPEFVRNKRCFKDKDRQMLWTPGLFSGKQLTAAMCLELRKQKPLSDALDGENLKRNKVRHDR